VSDGVIRAVSLAPQPLVLPGSRVAPAAPVASGRRESVDPMPQAPAQLPAAALEDLARREALAEERMAQAQAAFAAAEEAGHAEGLRRAAETARGEAERQLAQVGELLRDLAQARSAYQRRLEEEAVPVLVEVLVQVFGELGRHEALAVGAVRAAMGRMQRHQRLCLRVAPQHVPWMQRALQDGGLGLSPEDLDVVADASVAGGCVIDSEAGGLDASLPTQLARLVSLLNGPQENGDAG
jgi:flagellar assembly protein FliH